ncbi:MAG: ATP-binding cassette domain-containing protein, partial [Myxococcota bacterium]
SQRSCLLRVDDVVVHSPSGFRLGPVSFALGAGESLAVVGRAGAGKSLLLASLVGLLPASGGVVELGGILASGESLTAARQRAAFCFQRDALLDEVDAFENVMRAVAARRLDNPAIRARKALDEVGLSEAAAKFPAQLSGGMRRRLGIARALACDPAIFLGDALTAGLDPITTDEILTCVLDSPRSRERATVLSTHDVDAVLPRVDRVLVLEQGSVSFLGSCAALATQPGLEAFGYRRRGEW